MLGELALGSTRLHSMPTDCDEHIAQPQHSFRTKECAQNHIVSPSFCHVRRAHLTDATWRKATPT